MAFFEKFGSRLLRSCRNDLIACKRLVKITCVPIKFFPWHFSCSILREKVGQNLFSLERLPSFQKFVLRNILGPKELILLLPVYLPEYSLDPHKMFPEVCHTQQYEERKPKSFLHWKDCLFFKTLCFQTTSLVLKNWSFNFHSNCWITFWTLINRVLRFVTLDNARKTRPNFCQRAEIFFFWKVCFSIS